KQSELHLAARGRELDRVVHEIRHRFEQQIAVAMDCRGGADMGVKPDALLLGNRLVHVANLAYDVPELHVGETIQSSHMLDLRDAQQRGDDSERLVEPDDRAVDYVLQ